jgi:hypothetical protein
MQVISFYNDNTSPIFLDMQKRICERLGYPLQQIKDGTTDVNNHANCLNHFFENNKGEVLILDSDAVPLVSYNVFLTMVQDVAIMGGVQCPNHLPNATDYIGVACSYYDIDKWRDYGKHKFNAIDNLDVGGLVDKTFQRNGATRYALYPSEVQIPKWNLQNGDKFGIGTTYELDNINLFYHLFEARFKENILLYEAKVGYYLASLG